MKKLLKLTLPLLIAILFSASTFTQLIEGKIKQIDSLFLERNAPNHPGGALGVRQNGNLVYAEAFGLASLEYLVLNAPEIQYIIASLSKQFTALANGDHFTLEDRKTKLLSLDGEFV